MPKKNSPPKYRLHKARQCAVVTINGHNHYLAPFGSSESKQLYTRLIAEKWLPLQEVSTLSTRGKESSIMIDELMIQYMTKHVSNYYVDRRGKPSERQYHIRIALRPLHALFGQTPVNEFGPKRLKIVRNEMIESGIREGQRYSRSYINNHVMIIKELFRWGVEEELVPIEIHQSLLAVQQIRKGRDARLKEGEKILPVTVEHVEATLLFLAPQLATMVQLQLHAAMRPDEVTIMRPCDIDQTQETWIYRPDAHKTECHDISRIVPLGPKCRELLTHWIERPDNHFLFSPKEVVAATRANRRKSPSQKPENFSYSHGPRDHYDDETYCRAVKRACKRADVPVWTPNQLRHTAATFIREKYGIEAAKIILGHQSVSTTEIYAEKDLLAAMKIAETIG